MKKILQFVGMLVLMAIIYFAAHVAVYFAVVNFFSITSPLATGFFKGLLVFLAGSFFLSTWLTHLRDNVFTRAYYFCAALWLGLGVNLLLFFALAWTFKLLFFFAGMNLNEEMLGAFAVLGAFVYSAYGIRNNFSPRVTRIEVKIVGLPQTWVGRRIVQISDVHLGHIFGARYMSAVAKQINTLKPNAIVITGDLFDGTDGNLGIFVAPLNELEAPHGIYFASGNHETYLGTKEAFAIIAQTKIVPLRDQVCNVEGLQFVGIDYPERLKSKNLEAAIKNIAEFDSALPSILLWHIPTQLEGAKNAGISLQLSGHTHKGQLFPFGVITSFVYKGYDYGFKSDGQFSIYTSSGLGLWGPPMRTEKTSEIVEITLS